MNNIRILESTMTSLEILLWIKIIGTLIPVAFPLLFFPKSVIDQRSGFEASDASLYRLYGMAVLALLVGYFAGIVQVWHDEYPTGIIAMGFVSNAGAFLIMLITGRAKRMPLSAAFFGLIAAGLASSHLSQNLFMNQIW